VNPRRPGSTREPVRHGGERRLQIGRDRSDRAADLLQRNDSRDAVRDRNVGEIRAGGFDGAGVIIEHQTTISSATCFMMSGIMAKWIASD
jgi:hypothetical protein